MYIHTSSYAMSATAGKNGVSDPIFKRACARAADAVQTLKSHALPLITQCIQLGDLPAIEKLAADITARFSTVVVCGMGGSSLSGKMLTALAINPVTHISGKTNLLFLDNIDPASMDQLVASLDFSKTLFLLISKSGGTPETLVHAAILWEACTAKAGASCNEHFLAITETRDSPLTRFAASRKIRCLEHSPHIGGRYAALTLVGLLPAAIAGLDIRAIRKGASAVIDATFNGGDTAPAVQGAALCHILAEQGKNIAVMIPYCDRLRAFSMWHRQIWAESLGKNGKGITPAPALGAVDQHSQVQLYLDGPRDKFFTMIMLDQCANGPKIALNGESSLSYLHGRTIGDLMDAQQHATLETFTSRQCPVRVFSLLVLNEEALGALTMHFMLETILTAHLMDIDPFNQPAVEAGKKLAMKRLTDGC